MSDHDVESSSLYDITDSQQDVEDIKTFQPKNLQSLNGIECKDHDDQNREYLRLLESTPSSKPNQECETTKIICQSKTNQYDAQKQAAIDRYKNFAFLFSKAEIKSIQDDLYHDSSSEEFQVGQNDTQIYRTISWIPSICITKPVIRSVVDINCQRLQDAPGSMAIVPYNSKLQLSTVKPWNKIIKEGLSCISFPHIKLMALPSFDTCKRGIELNTEDLISSLRCKIVGGKRSWNFAHSGSKNNTIIFTTSWRGRDERLNAYYFNDSNDRKKYQKKSRSESKLLISDKKTHTQFEQCHGSNLITNHSNKRNCPVVMFAISLAAAALKHNVSVANLDKLSLNSEEKCDKTLTERARTESSSFIEYLRQRRDQQQKSRDDNSLERGRGEQGTSMHEIQPQKSVAKPGSLNEDSTDFVAEHGQLSAISHQYDQETSPMTNHVPTIEDNPNFIECLNNEFSQSQVVPLSEPISSRIYHQSCPRKKRLRTDEENIERFERKAKRRAKREARNLRRKQSDLKNSSSHNLSYNEEKKTVPPDNANKRQLIGDETSIKEKCLQRSEMKNIILSKNNFMAKNAISEFEKARNALQKVNKERKDKRSTSLPNNLPRATIPSKAACRLPRQPGSVFATNTRLEDHLLQSDNIPKHRNVSAQPAKYLTSNGKTEAKIPTRISPSPNETKKIEVDKLNIKNGRMHENTYGSQNSVTTKIFNQPRSITHVYSNSKLSEDRQIHDSKISHSIDSTNGNNNTSKIKSDELHFNQHKKNDEISIQSPPVVQKSILPPQYIQHRLLCSESFLECWGDVVTELASGRLGEEQGNDGMYKQKHKIIFADTRLVDECGVDIEIPGRRAILIFSSSSFETVLDAKNITIKVAKLVATGRYTVLYIFLCYDAEPTASVTRHIVQLQCSLTNDNGIPPTRTYFKTSSLITVAASISSTIFANMSNDVEHTGQRHNAVIDASTDELYYNRALYLISLLPTLSASGALECLLMAHEILPRGPSFKMLFQNERIRQQILITASSSHLCEVHPDAMLQLSRVLSVPL